jgi:hypothetical protein
VDVLPWRHRLGENESDRFEVGPKAFEDFRGHRVKKAIASLRAR